VERRRFIQTVAAGIAGVAAASPALAKSNGIRVSVRVDDPGYVGERFPIADVYLDGVPLRHCFTADERTGEAWCYATDAAGKFIIDGDHLRERYVRGNVRVVMRMQP
jgi:uncharacterized protein (DUF39 family)